MESATETTLRESLIPHATPVTARAGALAEELPVLPESELEAYRQAWAAVVEARQERDNVGSLATAYPDAARQAYNAEDALRRLRVALAAALKARFANFGDVQQALGKRTPPFSPPLDKPEFDALAAAFQRARAGLPAGQAGAEEQGGQPITEVQRQVLRDVAQQRQGTDVVIVGRAGMPPELLAMLARLEANGFGDRLRAIPEAPVSDEGWNRWIQTPAVEGRCRATIYATHDDVYARQLFASLSLRGPAVLYWRRPDDPHAFLQSILGEDFRIPSTVLTDEFWATLIPLAQPGGKISS